MSQSVLILYTMNGAAMAGYFDSVAHFERFMAVERTYRRIVTDWKVLDRTPRDGKGEAPQ